MTHIFECHCGDTYVPQRYILCFMVFLGVVFDYAMRNAINLALTVMVPAPKFNTSTGEEHADVCPGSTDIKAEGGPERVYFHWTERQQNYIFSAFFYGYVISHLPSGILADYFGGKHIFSAGVMVCGVCTLLTPLSIDIGDWQLLTAVRVIIGLSQGSLFPSCLSLISKWAPKDQRGRMGAIALSGSQAGTIAGNYITSVLIGDHGRWKWPFYFWSTLALVWYVFFVLMCFSYPSHSPYLSQEEKQLLEREIGSPEKLPIPWCAILTSLKVWYIVIANAGHDILFYFLSVQYPKYLNDVLKFEMRAIGLISSIPFLILFIGTNIAAVAADELMTHHILTIRQVRSTFSVIGSVPAAILLLAGSMAGCDRTLAIAFFTLSLISMFTFYPSVRINGLDLSKNFSGIIMAIVNGVGALSYAPIPPLTSVLVEYPSPSEWRKIIWVISGLQIGCAIPFALFVETERQVWDMPHA